MGGQPEDGEDDEDEDDGGGREAPRYSGWHDRCKRLFPIRGKRAHIQLSHSIQLSPIDHRQFNTTLHTEPAHLLPDRL